jgi:predicted DNA binding CopG/RHH family protein
MKSKIPAFQSDAEAENFVDLADLSQFDLSGAKMIQFELKPKDKSINLRMPIALFEAVRNEAKRAGLPYQRYIRLMLEQAVQPRSKGSS